MKTIQTHECGSIANNHEKSSAQEVLEKKGEIFSCGGVYLSTHAPKAHKNRPTCILHLPNRRKEILLVQGGQMQRSGKSFGAFQEEAFQELSGSQEVLRRISKDNLN